MNIDAVFSGGGVKGYAFLGALERIEDSQLHIVRAAGTSAGAIVASLLVAGYQIREIKQLIDELDLEALLDPPPLTKYIPFSKWVLFYTKMGFYKGDKLEQWLFEVLDNKSVRTFGDVQEGHLKMVVSDLTLGKLIVMPDDLYTVYGIHPDNFPIATAIRMSAGFPYFFIPKRLKGRKGKYSLMVDGGLLSNFPLWVFGNGQIKKRPLLGIHLDDEDDSSGEDVSITNAFGMLQALITTMKEAHDTRYIEQSQLDNLISIPISPISAMDLAIDQTTQERMIEEGYQQTDQFLAYWPRKSSKQKRDH